MKYIDSEKLIAGIKHLQEKFPVATYEALYHLITSLQQEQRGVDNICKDTLLNWAKTKLSHLQEDFDVYTGQRLILRELIDKIESL